MYKETWVFLLISSLLLLLRFDSQRLTQSQIQVFSFPRYEKKETKSEREKQTLNVKKNRFQRFSKKLKRAKNTSQGH